MKKGELKHLRGMIQTYGVDGGATKLLRVGEVADYGVYLKTDIPGGARIYVSRSFPGGINDAVEFFEELRRRHDERGA